jgi:GT2 family glycosyltransferase
MPDSRSVSIGLIIHNEQSKLDGCLRALLRNHRNPYSVSLILVDNASTDESLNMARDILRTANVPFQIIARTFNHMAHARNDAVDACSSAWLAFTDADCLVPDTWIGELMQALQSSGQLTVGVGGSNRPPTDHPYAKAWQILTEERHVHHGSVQIAAAAYPELSPAQHISTCNALFTHRALVQVGGFSASFARSGEDLDLSYKLRRAGGALAVAPGVCVQHEIPRQLLQWLARCWRYGSDQAPILSRHGWSVDRRRTAFVFATPLIVLLGVLKPWLWLLVVAVHWLWFMSRAAKRNSLGRSLQIATWIGLTHFTYGLACLWGLLLNEWRRLLSALRPAGTAQQPDSMQHEPEFL